MPELRLISRDIVPVDAGDLYERDVDHVSWRSDTLYRLLPRCQREGLVVVLVHSHPREVPDLSDTDTQTEPVLFDYGLDSRRQRYSVCEHRDDGHHDPRARLVRLVQGPVCT